MSNIEKIQKLLPEAGLDAMLLVSPVNRFYAVCFRSSEGAAVITKSGAFFFTDGRYIEAAGAAVRDAEVALATRDRPLSSLVREALSSSGAVSVGAEERWLSFEDYRLFEQKLSLTLKPAQGILDRLRASKTDAEFSFMRKAQKISERVLKDVLDLVKPGITEREIAAEITYRHLKYGAEGDSFPPIVLTGARTSMPHGAPGDFPVQAGDFVICDFGCVYGGYCSDMTRTFAVGHATDEMRRVYHIVLKAQAAGIQAARAGVAGVEVDAKARKVIEDAGFGEYFTHSFGHSLGLEIHEKPNFSPSEASILPEGAVVSAEPGIYLPGRFGVRTEDVVRLSATGCEDITEASKELIILPV